MFKKHIHWLIIFLILAFFSIWAVVSHANGYAFALMGQLIKPRRLPWTLLAVCGMFGNIFFEGKALSYLIRVLSPFSPKHDRSLLYSAADIYFSAITPSSTGGQPASAFFMIRDGIPAGTATVILIVNVFMYTLALMTVGIITWLFYPSLFFRFNLPSRILIGIGTLFLFLLCLLFILLLKKERWVRGIASFFISAGVVLHIIKDRPRYEQKAANMIAQYKRCVEAVKGKQRSVLPAYLLNLLQRLSLILVTLCIYMAFGGKASHLPVLFCIQSLVFIGAYSIPIPGAMGVSDYLLLNGLSLVPGISGEANIELASRSLSFYCCVIISVVIVIVGYYRQKKGREHDRII